MVEVVQGGWFELDDYNCVVFVIIIFSYQKSNNILFKLEREGLERKRSI